MAWALLVVGSSLLGIVMVGLIYVISDTSSLYDDYHISRIFWILLEDPALVIRMFVEIPGFLALLNLERVVPSALVLQLALALSAFWLIPRDEARICADLPAGNAD